MPTTRYMATTRLLVVYECARGMVTDLGEALSLQASDRTTTVLPRYGVWKMDTSRGKAHVTFTTDDLREAQAEADR